MANFVRACGFSGVQDGRQKFKENLIKMISNYIENHGKSIPKSTKVVPRSVPNAVLEAGRFQDLRGRVFRRPFWRHLGDFGRHFGTQLGGKGVPKSSILASRRAKMSKNEVQNEALKKV